VVDNVGRGAYRKLAMDARGPATDPDGPDDALRRAAIGIVATLRACGFQALWAGGCVRDMVLGQAPKDYDIATDATPDEVMALFARSIPVGAAFGVVRILEGPHEFEIATFRSDFGYQDGRRPTAVRWAGAEEDAQRRDFTINGLFYDPLAREGAGAIIDYVGGREDIARRIVRAIGEPEARFGEDYLRLIRAVRFASRFGFHIEARTFGAMVALADRVVRVSAERIFEEMDKILSHGDAARGVTLLEAAGLLEHILPEVDAVEAERRLQALAAVDDPGLARWAGLLADLEPEAVQAIALRLKTSRAFQKAVVEATVGARRLAAWSALTLADRKRLARTATFGVALEVARASGVATDDARRESASWDDEDLRPAPLVTGDDLRALGHAPGPAFRAALDAIESAQLEGRATTIADALAIATPIVAAR